MKKEDFSLIVIPMAEWDIFWLKEFFEILSQKFGVKVLFIQPSRFQIPFLLPRGQKSPFLIDKNQNLYIYHPFHPLPFGRFKVIHFLNSTSLSIQIRYLITKLNLENPFLFTTYPWWSMYLMGRCGEKGRIFYYADEYAEYPGGTEWWKRFIYKLTEEHIRKSDIVLTVNSFLYEKAKKINPSTFLFPNACPQKFVREVVNSKSSNEVIIGYLGRINDRIDFELLEEVISKKPEWKFQFVGGVEAGTTEYTLRAVERLKKMKNVELKGPVPQAQVPSLLREWSVAIIPFKKTPLTMGISPLKLYEYCGLGIPVVSVDIPGIEPLKEIVYIADTSKEFLEKIEIALSENKSQREKRREKIKTQHIWETRAREFYKMIKNFSK